MGRLILCLAVFLGFPLQGISQSYPSKPVHLVVGFPPGGANDILARLIGARMQEAWGQSVVVDNRPGANAIIGTELVAKSAPDGYTLLIGASGAMAFNPGLYDKLPYDPVRDFAPVTMLGSFPLVLAVNPSLAAQSVKELIALAKQSPGRLNYGAGSTPFQLAAELFRTQADVRIGHIPYKGSAATVTAVMANEVQLTFVDAPPALAQIKSGRIRALAVTSRTRAAVLPEVPTMIEAGLGNYDVVLWTSLFAPAGTPKPILDAVHAQALKALQTPDVRERMAGLGIEAVGNTPEQLGAILRADLEKWTAVAKSAGVKAE
jgi:tripartite-type tricarboxylate transporter receptor subunit TctC